jgi:multiple sugar transport system ATP-binding protein
MNFLDGEAKVNGNTAEVSFGTLHGVFHASAPIDLKTSRCVLGIRPEFIHISETEGIRASVYSTLPSGMETTVKAQCGDTMLTSVVFGSVDYPVDAAVRMAVTGENIVLFDKESGKSVGVGKLEIG